MRQKTVPVANAVGLTFHKFPEKFVLGVQAVDLLTIDAQFPVYDFLYGFRGRSIFRWFHPQKLVNGNSEENADGAESFQRRGMGGGTEHIVHRVEMYSGCEFLMIGYDHARELILFDEIIVGE